MKGRVHVSSKSSGCAGAAKRGARRAAQHRKDAGRHREPAPTVADLMAGPASAGAKLAAVGVIGTSAALITPAVASAGTAGPPPVATLAGTQPPPVITAQAPSGGLATFPNGKIIPPPPPAAPALAGPAGGATGSSSGGLATFPNGKIMPSPLFAAPAPPAGPATGSAPSAGAETAPAPVGGPGYPMLGPVPIGDALSLRLSGYDPVSHVGGTVAYTADPTGQTGGYLNIAVGLGVGGVFNAGYGPRASAGFGPQVRVVTGDVTMFAQWNQMNGTLSVSPSYDVANGVAVGGTWLFPMYPGGPAPQFVATRAGAWYSFGAEASVNYGVTVPLPKGSQILDALSRASAIQMYLDSGQPVPDELLHPAAPQQAPPTTDGAVPLGGGPALGELQTSPASSPGFPPVSEAGANSGLGSLTPDQLPQNGPTPQQLMIPLTPTATFPPPDGALPPNSYFDNLGQLRQLGQPAQEPPTPAMPFDPASSPADPAGQQDQPSTAPAAAPPVSSPPGSNLPLPAPGNDGQPGGATQQQGGSGLPATPAALPVVDGGAATGPAPATASVPAPAPADVAPAVPAVPAPAPADVAPAVPAPVPAPADVAPAVPAAPVIDTGTGPLSSTDLGTVTDPLSGITGDPADLGTGSTSGLPAPAALPSVAPLDNPAVGIGGTSFSSTDLGTSLDPVGVGSIGGLSGGAGS